MEETTISASTGTIRTIHSPPAAIEQRTLSQPSSPRSALPSLPDSPSGESVSSLPSVSSSFFYSSGAASPGHHQSDLSDQLRLVIPSLTLPPALPHATIYGQTLGDLKLLILGGKGIGKTTLANLLLESNDDVVEINGWEYFDEEGRANVLRASTDWIEHDDAHGLNNYEPARNVEIIELPGYDQQAQASTLTQSILTLIHAPFKSVHEILHPDQAPSQILANLLSSPYTPLYTALVLIMTSTPSQMEYSLIESLGPHIPIIILPGAPIRRHSLHLSSFRPATSTDLRSGLFRCPETLNTLRSEATDRFLRWREVERALHSLSPPEPYRSLRDPAPSAHNRPIRYPSSKWDKAKWEAEWEYTLSKDIAQRRRSTITPSSLQTSFVPPSFDPLHLPSIFMFSLSLLGPLRAKIFGPTHSPAPRAAAEDNDDAPQNRARKFPSSWGFITVVGAFCAGIGFGLMFNSR